MVRRLEESITFRSPRVQSETTSTELGQDEVEFEMNGLRLAARLAGGQKTGVFLDQRENYAAVRRFARGEGKRQIAHSFGIDFHLACSDRG